jgi:hypothetical protein
MSKIVIKPKPPQIQMHLSIGFDEGASESDEMDFDEDEYFAAEEKGPEALDEYLMNETREWANNYICYYYKIEEEDNGKN